MTTVSTKEHDYLEEDKPIKNQNYCLVSFISPEDVLVSKESYYLESFFTKISEDYKNLFNFLLDKYKDDKDLIENVMNNNKYMSDVKLIDEYYKSNKNINSEQIEKKFHEDNNFQTSIRGFKVRGSFDTINEAKNRCEFLKKVDKNHNIYIAQVGCWCPWSPNADDLEDQEYSETQLNTLMKEYKKNMDSKDEIFEKRKNDAINSNQSENTVLEAVVEEDNTTQVLEENTSKMSDMFTKDDPWINKDS
jgi:hypothetical protein